MAIRMRTGLVALAIVCGLLAAPVAAQEPPAPEITGAWVRATATEETAAQSSMAGMDVTALYMTLSNPTDAPLTLIGASSPVAGLVEVHESAMEADVMRMRHLEDGLEIPAGESVNLEPGGYHMMLMDVQYPLVVGMAVSATLTFQPAEGNPFDVILAAPVLDAPPPPSDLVFSGAWARPTVAEHPPATEAPADMDHEMPPATESIGEMHEATDESNNMHPREGSDADGDPVVVTDHSIPGVSAAYMTIHNRGESDIRLVSAAANLAALVEIHETQMENDVMRMRPLEDGLLIPAGQSVTLQPGGLHIMLMQLAQELAPGDALLLTLALDSGETIDVAVPVYDAGMAAMGM